MTQATLNFSGATYDPALDKERLASLYFRVYANMHDAKWRTLQEIANEAGLNVGSLPSISARLRDFRKLGHTVDRRRVEGQKGLWEYRLLVKGAREA